MSQIPQGAQQEQQQGGPVYGQPSSGYGASGPPPPAAAYGGGGAPYGGSPYGAPYGNPYGASPPYGGGPAYGGAPPAYGGGGPYGGAGPYAGSSPPYPPAAPVYAAGPQSSSYPYAQQKPPVYGKPSNTGNLEMGHNPDSPSAEEKITDQISVDIRHAFVRKVLGILAVQILFTFGVASLFGFVPVLRNFVIHNYWLGIVGAVGGFVLQMVLVCVPRLARTVPTNFIFMSIITLCYSLVLSVAAAASSRDPFLIAIGSTFVVVVGLMLFACQTKYDFTGCGTYLFVGMLCLLIFGILCLFFSNRIMQLVYSSIATVLFCMMLVYDTQLVVGGKHRRYEYSVDDYIFAALTLYMDIIIIFMNILAIADNA